VQYGRRGCEVAKKRILPDEVAPEEKRKPSFSLRAEDFPFTKDLKFKQEVELKVSAVVKGIREIEYEEGKPAEYEFEIRGVEALRGDEKTERSGKEKEKIARAVKKIKTKSKSGTANTIKAMQDALAKLEQKKGKKD